MMPKQGKLYRRSSFPRLSHINVNIRPPTKGKGDQEPITQRLLRKHTFTMERGPGTFLYKNLKTESAWNHSKYIHTTRIEQANFSLVLRCLAPFESI